MQADLFRHICIILHPLIFLRSVHSQDNRRFDYEAPLVATNENMPTGNEPAVKKERMQHNTNKSKEIGLYSWFCFINNNITGDPKRQTFTRERKHYMGIPLTIAMHRKNLNYSSLRFYDLLVVFVSFFAILQRCNRKMHQWISIALDFLKIADIFGNHGGNE